MAELTRQGWLQLFTQMRRPNGFLTRMFTVKPGGQYNGNEVNIDIERIGEDVAIAITKCSGVNMNDISTFTTKKFTPPAYGEGFPIEACDLLNRMAGVDPYSAAYTDYRSQLTAMFAKGMQVIGDKITRAVELQASQILQTGILSLTDENGAVAYTLDFKPKATHFPTTSNSWSGGSATPMADLESLADVIRVDGQIDVDMALFGKTSFKNFMGDAEVQSLLDNRRISIGEIAPQFVNSGATFQGFMWIGNYEVQMWTYPDTYKDPQTGNPVKFIADDKVVLMSSGTRLDMASAIVPKLVADDPRVAGLAPDRIQSRDSGFDVLPTVYASLNGKQVIGELESRVLLIPVQIDGYGCLDTEI